MIAKIKKPMPDAIRIRCAGKKPSSRPATTATSVCTRKANQAPRMTLRARYLLARIKAAKAVLSGSSARKIIPNVENIVASENIGTADIVGPGPGRRYGRGAPHRPENKNHFIGVRAAFRRRPVPAD